MRHHLARPLKRHRRARGREQVEQGVLDLLRSVNLTPAEEVARKHPHELSGGQRQRVAIARSPATNPSVLLADEPVSVLDVSIRLEILNLLDRLKQERDLALLYVTHDLATARHFAKDIMVLYRGEVVECGPSDEVILKPAHPHTQALAEAAPDPHAVRDPLDPTRTAPAPSPTRSRAARRGSAKAASSAAGARTRWTCARSGRPNSRWREARGTPPGAGCCSEIARGGVFKGAPRPRRTFEDTTWAQYR